MKQHWNFYLRCQFNHDLPYTLNEEIDCGIYLCDFGPYLQKFLPQSIS